MARPRAMRRSAEPAGGALPEQIIAAGKTAGSDTTARTTAEGTRFYTVGPDGETVEVGRLGFSDEADFLGFTDDTGALLASLDSTGRVVGQEVFAGVLWVGGEQLATVLARRPRGIVQRGIQTVSSPAATGVNPEYGVFEIAATVYAGRLYKVVTSALRCRNTAPPGEGAVRLRYTTGDTTPSVTSSVLNEVVFTDQYGTGDAKTLQRLYEPTSDQRLRVLISVARVSGGDCYIEGSTSNPIEVWIEDLGPARPNGGVTNNSTSGSTPTTTPKQQRQSTWRATWSASYRGDGSKKNDNGDMVQGQTPWYPSDGNQRALFGFEGGAIEGSDYFGDTLNDVLSSVPDSDILKVELLLYATHWHYDSGGTAVLGYHTHTSAPGTFSATATDVSRSAGWPKPGERWVDITSGWPKSWGDAGGVRGIALGPAPSTDALYYGRFAGAGAAVDLIPRLRITYRK